MVDSMPPMIVMQGANLSSWQHMIRMVLAASSPWVLLDVVNRNPLLVIHHKDLVEQVHALRGELGNSLLDVGDVRPEGPHLLQPVEHKECSQQAGTEKHTHRCRLSSIWPQPSGCGDSPAGTVKPKSPPPPAACKHASKSLCTDDYRSGQATPVYGQTDQVSATQTAWKNPERHALGNSLPGRQEYVYPIAAGSLHQFQS